MKYGKDAILKIQHHGKRRDKKMNGRIKVIMTKEGMNHLRRDISYGYIISRKASHVYILEDGKKLIKSYHKDFWKPYHIEELDLFNSL